MVEMTVSQLRGKINDKLNSARLQVQKLEEQLKLIDSFIQEEEKEIEKKKEISTEQNESTRKLIIKPFFQADELTKKDSIGGVITKTIRNIDKEISFSVQTIVKMIKDKFPDISYTELSKKASTKTYRLEKRGEIELVKRGHGRDPHIYRRIK
jgi:hypothetical protein